MAPFHSGSKTAVDTLPRARSSLSCSNQPQRHGDTYERYQNLFHKLSTTGQFLCRHLKKRPPGNGKVLPRRGNMRRSEGRSSPTEPIEHDRHSGSVGWSGTTRSAQSREKYRRPPARQLLYPGLAPGDIVGVIYVARGGHNVRVEVLNGSRTIADQRPRHATGI
jgi:hypothetical protein